MRAKRAENSKLRTMFAGPLRSTPALLCCLFFSIYYGSAGFWVHGVTSFLLMSLLIDAAVYLRKDFARATLQKTNPGILKIATILSLFGGWYFDELGPGVAIMAGLVAGLTVNCLLYRFMIAGDPVSDEEWETLKMRLEKIASQSPAGSPGKR